LSNSYSYRSSSKSSVASRYPQRNRGQRKTNQVKRGQYIDPSRFIKEAVLAETEAYVPKHSFIDFAFTKLLKDNLDAKGYSIPSPIQDQAIPVALNGQDVIGIASTGTGKTAAFALPVLNKLINDRSSAVLVVAPTRELAQQIEEEFRSLSRGSGLRSTLLIGGTGMGNQLRDLRYNPRVVIGTPGRIKDHLQRKTLNLSNFNIIVLDEVDRMLDMGFVNDVTEILSRMSNVRQSLFFSATMDNRVRNLINTFTSEPFTISLSASVASENVHQNIVQYQGSTEKKDKLHDLLLSENVRKAIVFDETQRSVERLGKDLLQRGFKVEAIHGGKSQGQRRRALARFKNNEVSILVATDVAARGIDVIDITHVINFSVPKVYDDYIHRIGRAGRAGQIGYALTFVTN
jgi:ATP-dependent RNA helicase RhlE